MKTAYFNRGDIVFEAGSSSNCAYLIKAGIFEAFCLNSEGEKQVIGVLGRNDIFGEMGLIDGKPRSATVKALSKGKAAVLTRDSFSSLENLNPQALMPLLKVLTGRVREAFQLAKLQTPSSIYPLS